MVGVSPHTNGLLYLKEFLPMAKLNLGSTNCHHILIFNIQTCFLGNCCPKVLVEDIIKEF